MLGKTKRIEHKIKGFIIEKNLHRTWKERLFHTLCLIIPIFSTFLGYYLSPVIYSLVKKSSGTTNAEALIVPETVKLFITLIFFLVPVIIIFVTSRNTNPIMKISVTSEQNKESEN